ncbi:MAG: hypothetical protein K0S38_1077 [Candidatus Paceibacter sp.]|jgi:hypothetical protein|nr:hypothetical protein [Candidatus Paceibacter sp.]
MEDISDIVFTIIFTCILAIAGLVFSGWFTLMVVRIIARLVGASEAPEQRGFEPVIPVTVRRADPIYAELPQGRSSDEHVHICRLDLKH